MGRYNGILHAKRSWLFRVIPHRKPKYWLELLSGKSQCTVLPSLRITRVFIYQIGNPRLTVSPFHTFRTLVPEITVLIKSITSFYIGVLGESYFFLLKHEFISQIHKIYLKPLSFGWIREVLVVSRKRMIHPYWLRHFKVKVSYLLVKSTFLY